MVGLEAVEPGCRPRPWWCAGGRATSHVGGHSQHRVSQACQPQKTSRRAVPRGYELLRVAGWSRPNQSFIHS